MNWYNYVKKKVGLGGWSIYDVGDNHIYSWRSAWATVDYHFEKKGIVRKQVKGSHPMYSAIVVHAKGTFKYNHLKCQLLALDDGIYHNPNWWREAVNDYTYGRTWSKPQYNLVEKYINKEV